MNLINIIYIIASIASVFLYIFSVQFNKKENILKMQVGASSCYLIVYLIKNMRSGSISEVLELIKNIIFIKSEKKKGKIPLSLLLTFLSLLIFFSILFYDGIFSLLPLIINILLFTSTYYKNPQVIRRFMLICGVLWGIYNLYAHAYIIVIGNILEIVSASISLYRFKKVK